MRPALLMLAACVLWSAHALDRIVRAVRLLVGTDRYGIRVRRHSGRDYVANRTTVPRRRPVRIPSESAVRRHGLRFVASLGAFVLAACGPSVSLLPPNVPLRLAPVEAITALTIDAAERIDAAYGSRIVVVVDQPGSIKVLERCGDFNGTAIGVGPCGCADGGQSTEVVLVHEIGHALMGPQHSEDPASIMFARFRPMTIDDAVNSLVTELRK